jgi:hypothetical protein
MTAEGNAPDGRKMAGASGDSQTLNVYPDAGGVQLSQ